MFRSKRWKPIPGVPKYNIHEGTCCPKLIQDIENLAFGELQTPDSYIQEGSAMSNIICRKLQQNNFGISVDRFRIAGSVGKGTCISYVNKSGYLVNPDFDVVPYINDMEPPFKDVIDAMGEMVENLPRVHNVRTTKISVQFDYESVENGRIKFDLVPAGNYVKQPCNRQDIAEVEARESEELVQEEANFTNDGIVTREICRIHSTGFCEKGMEIVKSYVENDPMMLGVVRLAKYWKSQIDLGGLYVPAKSYVIELIAIRCQRGRKRRSLISCFRRFLEAMSVLGQLVMFSHVRFDDPGLQQLLTSTPPPIICNIANPKDNLADGMEEDAILVYEYQARRTLEVLDDIKDQYEYYQVDNPIFEIFSHKNLKLIC